MWNTECEHCKTHGLCGYYEYFCNAGLKECKSNCSRFVPLGTAKRLMEEAKEKHWKSILGAK